MIVSHDNDQPSVAHISLPSAARGYVDGQLNVWQVVRAIADVTLLRDKVNRAADSLVVLFDEVHTAPSRELVTELARRCGLVASESQHAVDVSAVSAAECALTCSWKTNPGHLTPTPIVRAADTAVSYGLPWQQPADEQPVTTLWLVGDALTPVMARTGPALLRPRLDIIDRFVVPSDQPSPVILPIARPQPFAVSFNLATLSHLRDYLLQFIDSLRAVLVHEVRRLLAVLTSCSHIPSIGLRLLAVCRRYGRRGESGDDGPPPIPQWLTVIRGEPALSH